MEWCEYLIIIAVSSFVFLIFFFHIRRAIRDLKGNKSGCSSCDTNKKCSGKCSNCSSGSCPYCNPEYIKIMKEKILNEKE